MIWNYLLDKGRSLWAGSSPSDRAPVADLFPAEFERAVHRLASDPNAPSIPARLCLDHFGDDLLRYVPPPRIGLKSVVRMDGSGARSQGFLDGKNWDPLKFSLELSPQFKLARELAGGTPYRDTKVYRSMLEKLARGRLQPVNGVPLDTREKIDRYCEYVQWLIDSVRENGLRSRREADRLFEPSFDGVRSTGKETVEKEIQIAVDERGDLLRLNTGRHRLAVAHALGLPEVPAKIHLVHVGWILALVRETGARPDLALRQWLARLRSAAGRTKARAFAALCGAGEAGEIALALV